MVALGEGATWRLSPRTERARARPTANVKAKSGSVVVRRRETVRLVGHPVLDLHALAYVDDHQKVRNLRPAGSESVALGQRLR